MCSFSLFCNIFHYIFFTSTVIVVIFVQTGLHKSFRPIKRVQVNEIPEYGEAHSAVCSVERKNRN